MTVNLAFVMVTAIVLAFIVGSWLSPITFRGKGEIIDVENGFRIQHGVSITLPEPIRDTARLVNGQWMTYQHDQEVEELEGRRRLGPLMQGQAPAGYSTCGSCRWPWPFVEGHTVMYSESSGMFAVCEWCWKRLRDLGRDEELRGYYMAHFDDLQAKWPEEERKLLKVALDRELGGPRAILTPRREDPR